MPVDKVSLQLVTQLMEKRGWIELPARGTSMYPLIKQGDICRFVPTEAAHIRKGDILLFHVPLGNLVAHRFAQCVKKNHQQYLCKGDTNLAYDEAIAWDQIIGRMTWIQREERIIHVTELAVHLWGRLVLAVPLISLCLRMYLNRREGIKA
ncbi:S24/S26 family peptidase [Paenibacillus alba]|uniref:S24/S26 family peptidase n=1 Tax=Paenibacillus alba TaxID=1197127 RepID=A0ABU6G1G0_9BACL|nr:S24/S26 family peptidase [Paenibacillus alba]MEC0228003.1 S24/S26 family peptidase [Paenibacillus alba]